MFRDSRMITGKKAIKVSTILIKTVTKSALKKKKETTKAATANATPTA